MTAHCHAFTHAWQNLPENNKAGREIISRSLQNGIIPTLINPVK